MSKENEKPKLPTGKITKKSNFSFEYEFTEAELKEKSEQLSRAVIERTAIEQEKKTIVAQFTSKIESKTSEIGLSASFDYAGRRKIKIVPVSNFEDL